MNKLKYDKKYEEIRKAFDSIVLMLKNDTNPERAQRIKSKLFIFYSNALIQQVGHIVCFIN